MINYISIIGWARGGTTLVKNLFSCFEDTWISPGSEIDNIKMFWEGIPSEVATSNVVLKFHYNQFTNTGDVTGIDELFRVRERSGGKLLYLIRDPRDTIVSNMATNSDWESLEVNCKLVCETIEEVCPLLIKYEDLCMSPDDIQSKIADYYGLEIEHPFSRGNERYRSIDEDAHVSAMGGGHGKDPLRAIDTTSIGLWRNHLHKERVRDAAAKPDIAEFIEKFY